jgi:hypothetical protein
MLAQLLNVKWSNVVAAMPLGPLILAQCMMHIMRWIATCYSWNRPRLVSVIMNAPRRRGPTACLHRVFGAYCRWLVTRWHCRYVPASCVHGVARRWAQVSTAPAQAYPAAALFLASRSNAELPSPERRGPAAFPNTRQEQVPRGDPMSSSACLAYHSRAACSEVAAPESTDFKQH